MNDNKCKQGHYCEPQYKEKECPYDSMSASELSSQIKEPLKKEYFFAGNINKQVYDILKQTFNIKNPEVVITDKWFKNHIEPGHEKFYENNKHHIAKIINDPDYIFIDKNHNDTVIFVGEIEESQIVISLNTKRDDYSNTIITFFPCGEKTLQRMKRSKQKIYQK